MSVCPCPMCSGALRAAQRRSDDALNASVAAHEWAEGLRPVNLADWMGLA